MIGNLRKLNISVLRLISSSVVLHFDIKCCFMSVYWHLLKESCFSVCVLTQSQSISLNPLYVMIPCTLSASFAFMLPVATPPNAIVFSYGLLKVSDMVSEPFDRTEKKIPENLWSHNNHFLLLRCAPCRLEQAWWWTSSGSAASVWPSTVGVTSYSAWTLSLHGPTPLHLCRNNNLRPHFYSVNIFRLHHSTRRLGEVSRQGILVFFVFILQLVTAGSEPPETLSWCLDLLTTDVESVSQRFRLFPLKDLSSAGTLIWSPHCWLVVAYICSQRHTITIYHSILLIKVGIQIILIP